MKKMPARSATRLTRSVSQPPISMPNMLNSEANIVRRDLPGGLEAFVAALGQIPLEFSPGNHWNYSVATGEPRLQPIRSQGLAPPIPALETIQAKEDRHSSFVRNRTQFCKVQFD
jgi:hypothetical protein